MAVGTALAIGGMAMNAYGSYKSGKANKDAAKAQAALGEFNAKVSEQDAIATEMKTKFDQVRQIRMGERIMGRTRAKLGASGAVLSEGAPLAVMADQAFELELENALIGHEGMTEAARHRSDAVAMRMGASAAERRGKAAMTAGYINAGASLLSGFGSMYNQGMFS